MEFFKPRSWKEKREYNRQNAKTLKLAKGERLTAREKAIRSQGYMSGQVNAWDEGMYKTDKAGFKKIQDKRKAKRQEYKRTHSNS